MSIFDKIKQKFKEGGRALKNLPHEIKDHLEEEFKEVREDFTHGIDTLETKITEGFHGLEHDAKREVVRKILSESAEDLREIVEAGSHFIPAVKLKMAFVDITISGLNDETDGKTGAAHLLDHFEYWKDNFHWDKDSVSRFLGDPARNNWINFSLEIAPTVAVPIIGDCGVGFIWTESEIVEGIDDICKKLGVL